MSNLARSGCQQMVPEPHTLRLQVLYIGMSQQCHCSLEYQSEIKKKKKVKILW